LNSYVSFAAWAGLGRRSSVLLRRKALGHLVNLLALERSFDLVTHRLDVLTPGTKQHAIELRDPLLKSLDAGRLLLAGLHQGLELRQQLGVGICGPGVQHVVQDRS
jgi:hypothetical protein